MAPELEGYGVVLTPTQLSDAPALAAIAARSAAEAYRWTFVPRTSREWQDTIEGYATTGRYIYTVRLEGEHGLDVVGTTGYYDLEFWKERDAPDACEVGHTWYIPRVRGTTVNPACKLLLFAHAFDTWDVERLAMRTDARNAASRAAMLKLGMTYEGVRRRHMPGADGTFRDSAFFSAVREEWPAIKRGLEARLHA